MTVSSGVAPDSVPNTARRRVVQVGVSYQQACGIRAYAEVLGGDLARRGCSVESVWWERDDGGSYSPDTLAGLRRWGRALRHRARREGTDVVLWHYSVFGYGWRGIPVFVLPVARRLARSGVPVVLVLHEFGLPWWWPGWRGRVFAATHRLALVPVMRCASNAVVTTEKRRQWIRERWWLPLRPIAFEPVFSTVQVERGNGGAEHRSAPTDIPSVGVFGYAAARMRPDVVLDALRILGQTGRKVRLRLVGAPGRDDPGGERWQAAADAARADLQVDFTGPLEPAPLSRALSSLDLVVFPDGAGPTSRKTTLAAALAHGCCVVALSGPDTWSELVDERAVVVSPPDAAGLAKRLRALLDDDEERRAQGARAADFYARHMAPDVIVGRLWPLLFPAPPTKVTT